MKLTREDAKNLLGLATCYDYLSGDAGVAVTEEMIEDHSKRVLILRGMIARDILNAAPVAYGWRKTNEWIQKQTVI